MITAEVKKEFQKVIAAIRKELNTEAGKDYEYPKAMMTAAQRKKDTATVNCGGSFTRRDRVMAHPAFIAFCEKHNATAEAERITYGTYTQHQLRLRFQEAAPQIIGVDLAADTDRTGCFAAIKKPAEVQ